MTDPTNSLGLTEVEMLKMTIAMLRGEGCAIAEGTEGGGCGLCPSCAQNARDMLFAADVHLNAAWTATGVADTMRGLTRLDDVIETLRTDLDVANARIKELEDAATYVPNAQQIIDAWKAEYGIEALEAAYAKALQECEGWRQFTDMQIKAWAQLRVSLDNMTDRAKKAELERDELRACVDTLQSKLTRSMNALGVFDP